MAALGEEEYIPQVTEKTQSSLVKNTPPMECQKVGEAIVCTARTVTWDARTALELIREALQAGQEPTVNEIADKIGLTPTGLGMTLLRLGIKAKNTHRAGQTLRIYTKPMKPQIEAVLAQDNTSPS